MPISPSQIRLLHLLLNHNHLMWQKQTLISSFTNGRTEHSREMTASEISDLITHLRAQSQDNDIVYRNKQMDLMRKKLLSYSYEMGWAKPRDWKSAIKKIDEFCSGRYGIYKKTIREHTYEELVNVVTQFGNLYMKAITK